MARSYPFQFDHSPPDAALRMTTVLPAADLGELRARVPESLATYDALRGWGRVSIETMGDLFAAAKDLDAFLTEWYGPPARSPADLGGPAPAPLRH